MPRGTAAMSTASASLSLGAWQVLSAIARGCRYETILAEHPELTYLDVFDAAREARCLLDGLAGNGSPLPPLDGERDDRGEYAERLARIRQRYPRAYAPWSPEEDDQIRAIVGAGRRPREIAEELERRPG